ncbi:MAG: DNA-protecting protein DprA [Aquificae bacterium]|nr:DNA-protecting protein DprA [Aquificota bacterium]
MSIIDYIEISFIKGLGNRLIKQIYEEIGDISQALIDPYTLERFGEKVVNLIKNRPSELRGKAEQEYKRAKALGVDIITLDDERYPQLLKEIPDPPPYLYVKGVLKDTDRLVSVVGSRRHSRYGEEITKKVASFLASNGIGVVSGMAEGIDGIAHKQTLQEGGYTIAVLGSGIDQIFPYSNRKLYHRIVESGCVISEFPIGTKPSKYTFPVRNRIIAGLSVATVVVEAGEKSGALITANLSNDYGRVVFTVPSNITNPYAKGSNGLLKDGAIPLLQVEDIVENIPYLSSVKSVSTSPVSLSDTEEKILLSLDQPKHIDMVAEAVGLDVDSLMVIVFEMEMKGLVSLKDGVLSRA